MAMKLSLISFIIFQFMNNPGELTLELDWEFAKYIIIGFIAQMIDGTLGMAYGVSCSTLLLSFGVSPKVATASVHTAEVFTTGVSGLSHLRLGNIDKKLFSRIVITGVIGSVTGAYLISDIIDGNFIKPYITAYLLILGVVILIKGIRNKAKEFRRVKRAELLALVGGLLDAIGGGGWGPIVTSNIINQGNDPRQTVGTVNTAEFFVTFFSTGVFMFFVGIESWKVVLGLISGGVLAAPFGALLLSRINRRAIMIAIGIVIIVTSLYSLMKLYL